ncbi:MAG: chemotaxis protein CheW, partial [Janthinobacterium sp.]
MSDTQQTSGSNAGDGKDIAGREFLAFTLGSEEYGIDILKVQEIRGYGAVTRIANAPAFLKGFIHLRGSIVPLVDLRIALGQAAPAYDASTVVIILVFAHGATGIVVDRV